MKIKSFLMMAPLMAAAACGTGAAAEPEVPNSDARDYTLAQVSGYCAAASQAGPDTLAGYLKNDSFDLVVGEVGEVKFGKAYQLAESAGGTPEDPAKEVSFDQDGWDWGFVDASVTDESGESTEISFATYPNSDTDRFSEGVAALGRVVVVASALGGSTEQQVPGQCYKLVGLVADDGHVSFPALGEDESAFVDGVDTLDEMRELAG